MEVQNINLYLQSNLYYLLKVTEWKPSPFCTISLVEGFTTKSLTNTSSLLFIVTEVTEVKPSSAAGTVTF